MLDFNRAARIALIPVGESCAKHVGESLVPHGAPKRIDLAPERVRLQDSGITGSLADMSGTPDVDAYIAKAAPFAQPIFAHLRALVHAACPDVSESLKWGMPAFSAQGRLIATMAAHKAHASFGFWNGDVVAERREGGMGQFGRITSLADLPDDEAFKTMVREAVAAAQRPRGSKPAATAKDVPVTPPDLASALGDNIARFDAMPPSHRREYVEWIEDAKRPDTRAKRIAQAAEWIAEGKSRNWKYERR